MVVHGRAAHIILWNITGLLSGWVLLPGPGYALKSTLMRMRYWLLSSFGLVFLLVSCSGGDDDTDSGKWPDISSWVYQLQPSASQTRRDFIEDLAGTGFDVVVIDYSLNGGPDAVFTRSEIQEIKSSGKTVLCYISIGEAEDYRWYWQAEWDTAPPDWLGPENPNWPGNYLVRFWDPGWQAIIFQYIDTIVSQGFDGLYLDKVDSYEDYQDSTGWADDSMIAFVHRIADSAGGLLIIPQNACDLLEVSAYADLVDGIGNEDVYYTDEQPNDSSEIAWVVDHLKILSRMGKPVMVVDYPEQAEHIEDFYNRARADGFVPYRTVKELDSLVINPQDPE